MVPRKDKAWTRKPPQNEIPHKTDLETAAAGLGAWRPRFSALMAGLASALGAVSLGGGRLEILTEEEVSSQLLLHSLLRHE
jgi:hypothetical protein